MRQANESAYGFATFNLTAVSGVGATAYGHLGATYGYQSITAYFPLQRFAIAFASNIEIDSQSQSPTGLCKAFHGALAVQEGRPVPTCEFKSAGYFGGVCECNSD